MNKDKYLFDELSTAPLVPGSTYISPSGAIADYIFPKLLNLSNSGGMRSMMHTADNKRVASPVFMAIISNPSAVEDYPDKYNPDTQTLIYYGDQRKPYIDKFKTNLKGNSKIFQLYKDVYENNLDNIFPIFYFEKAATGRSHKYIGLAFPFVADSKLSNVASTVEHDNISNLKFTFTIDNVSTISREFIDDLMNGKKESEHAPTSWINFQKHGITIPIETKAVDEQSEYQFSIQTEEIKREVKVRQGQQRLRKELINKFKTCEICGIKYPELLIASHIVP